MSKDMRRYYPQLRRCRQCNKRLSASQVALAIVQCMPEQENLYRLTLYCPGYNWGTQACAKTAKEAMAFWMVTYTPFGGH